MKNIHYIIYSILIILLIISVSFNIFNILNSNTQEIKQNNEGISLIGGSFSNYESPYNLGWIVIKNNGSRSLDPTKFKLYLNHDLVNDKGCDLNGSIDPGFPCRMEFNETCNPGDAIIAEYNGEKIHVDSC